MDIGEYIKEYRIKNHLTQKQFGNKIGVNKQTISKWENGIQSPSTKKLYEIFDIIDISPCEFIEEKQFIYKKKMRYDVGLYSLFLSVHDFFSFLSFIDAFKSAFKLLTPQSNFLGCLLLNKDILSDKDSYRSAIPIEMICVFEDSIIIEIPDYSFQLNYDHVSTVKRIISFNNEAYLFHIYLNNKKNDLIQLILSFGIANTNITDE